MSLRFLKAKPKLTLSKDNKIRSLPKNEDSKTNHQSQNQSTGKNLTENQPKDTSSIIPPKPESTCENEKSELSIQDNIVSNTNSNLKYHDGNLQSNVTLRAKSDFDSIKSQEKIETHENVEILESNDKKERNTSNRSDKSSVANKFKFLRAKPKLGLNFPSKIRSKQPQQECNEEQKQEVENKNKIKDTSHDATDKQNGGKENEFKDKNDSVHTDDKSDGVETIASEHTLLNIDGLDGKNTKKDNLNNVAPSIEHNLPQKNILSKDVPISTSNKLESSKIELESNESKSLNHTQNKFESVPKEKSTVSYEQVKNPVSRKSNRIKTFKYSENSSVPEVEKVSPTKTKSLSSFLKQLENEKLLSSQSGTQPQEQQKLKTMVQTKNFNLPAVESDKHVNVKVDNLIKSKDLQVIENKEKTSNSLKSRKPAKRIQTESVQSKVKKITNHINNSINELKNTTSYETKTKSIPITNKSKSHINEAKPKNNSFKETPVVMEKSDVFNTIDSMSSDTHYTILPELKDHVYAKSIPTSSSQKNTDMISLETVNSKAEKYADSEKNYTAYHTDKQTWKNPSIPTGLNPLQKALLLRDFEDDEMSDSSECEPQPFVDINSCIVHPEEGNQDETPVCKIYYSFNDKSGELGPFSGLSLVTKLIKDEKHDPFAEEEDNSPENGHVSHEHSYSNHTEETVNTNNIEFPTEENITYFEEVIDGNISCYEEEIGDSKVRYEDNYDVENNHESKNAKPRKRKNVTFNFEEDINHVNIDTMAQENDKKRVIKKPQRKKTPKDSDNSQSHVKYVDLIDTTDLNNAERLLDAKIEVDHEYKPKDESVFNSSDSEIDIEEREFVIYGKRNTGGKKKVSDSIYLKRQSETLKKIKTQASWRETLTVNDLIFYNPESNPMTNPPDIAVVNKTEKILENIKTEKENVTSEDEEDVDNPEPVPQLKISADGRLIIDPKSLIIEETGLKKNKKLIEQSDALIESKYTVKKFDLYTKKKRKPIVNEWGPEDTIMFYRAVNTIGTDFSMMASLFENRTRADIKRKFKLEERKNPTLLTNALRNYNSFDIEELRSELEADKRRVERIRKEELERKKMLKEEKKKERKLIRKPQNRSVCGKLTRDCTLKRTTKYVGAHQEMVDLWEKTKTIGIANTESNTAEDLEFLVEYTNLS